MADEAVGGFADGRGIPDVELVISCSILEPATAERVDEKALPCALLMKLMNALETAPWSSHMASECRIIACEQLLWWSTKQPLTEAIEATLDVFDLSS